MQKNGSDDDEMEMGMENGKCMETEIECGNGMDMEINDLRPRVSHHLQDMSMRLTMAFVICTVCDGDQHSRRFFHCGLHVVRTGT